MAKPMIIVALDGMNYENALQLAEKLSQSGVLFKANDLLDDIGPAVLATLGKFGGVMADPKLHDIPNTVANRVKKYAVYNPGMLTVHASGGVAMMRKAAENHKGILAVTVLTTLGEEECTLNLGGPVKAKVLQYARNAVLANVYGIVCSAQELEFLSKFPELDHLVKVTPGIRPAWHIDPKDDQKRIVTPAQATKLGADYIVIGRPIVEAADPVEAVRKTKEEIEAA